MVGQPDPFRAPLLLQNAAKIHYLWPSPARSQLPRGTLCSPCRKSATLALLSSLDCNAVAVPPEGEVDQPGLQPGEIKGKQHANI